MNTPKKKRKPEGSPHRRDGEVHHASKKRAPHNKATISSPHVGDEMKTMQKTIQELQKEIKRLTDQQNMQFNKQEIPNKMNTSEQKQSKQSVREKKRNFIPFNMEIESHHNNTSTYYEIYFLDGLKRSVSAFTVKSYLTDKTSSSPISIRSINQSSYIVEMKAELDIEHAMITINHIDSVPCKISLYKPFNNSRAIIYIEEYDLSSDQEFADFKAGLMEEHKDIIAVDKAPFIKPRTPNTTALIITFSTQRTPYSIYIPGERSDTRVYHYFNKPMLCANCQNYGHTAKRCKSDIFRCRKCSKTDHKTEQCITEHHLCYHCQGDHPTGNKLCTRFQKESSLVRIQSNEKVGILRAKQISDGIIANRPTTGTSPILKLDLVFSETDKKTFRPFSLQNSLKTIIGQKPKSVRTINSTTYFIEVNTIKQADTLLNTSSIGGCSVMVRESRISSSSQPKGVVYISEYDLTKFDSYREELLKCLPITDVIIATWRKSFNTRSKALLLTFNCETIPEYLNIPGELALVKVYEQKPRPMLCKRCLNFRHTEKHCVSDEQICGKCSQPNHSADKCEATKLKCYHCGEEHKVADKNCRQYQYECEIFSIQLKKSNSSRSSHFRIHEAASKFSTDELQKCCINKQQ